MTRKAPVFETVKQMDAELAGTTALTLAGDASVMRFQAGAEGLEGLESTQAKSSCLHQDNMYFTSVLTSQL